MILLRTLLMFETLVLLRIRADTFPSLLTTNATLAVVIDREYLAEKYENIKDVIEDYLVYAKRDILKHGGVNVQFYSWTSINIKRENDCPRMPTSEAFTVPLLKPGEELPQLLFDLRTSNIFKWTSAIILYDTTLDRDIVTRVVTALTKESQALRKNSAVSIMRLDTNSTVTVNRQTITEALKNVSPKTLGGNFLAIVSLENMEIIMDVAKDLGMVTPITQWLYVICDTNSKKDNISTVNTFLKEGDNVAFVYNTTASDTSCKGGLECHAREILEAFARSLESAIVAEYELATQVSDEEWEAIRPTKTERRNILLYNVKTRLSQYGSCDNCTSWRFQAGETWGTEFLVEAHASRPEVITVGSWRPSDGASMTDELFPHVSHGFRGRNLPLVTYHNPPWQIITTNGSGMNEYGGIVFDIIKEIASTLNFTYTLEVIHVDTRANQTVRNNSKSHVVLDMTNVVTYKIPDKFVQMVQSKRAAIGAAAFSVTEQSKMLINFTRSISTQPYTFLVARPRELSRALLFMSPFTKDTWFCLAAAIVSMGPILYYIHRYSPVYEYKGIPMKGGLSSITNCIWYMYGALLQQGGMYLPYADSARIIVGAWWLVVLVVSTTYCGNLVAFLTFPKIDIPIATLNNLLEHRDSVTWSISKGSFLEYQMKTSAEQKYRDLYSGGTDLDLNSEEMLPLIQEGKHIFIDWKIRLQYVMRKQYLITDTCNLALGSDEFFDETMALIVAQDTPYLPKINEEIKRLHQNGLIEKWMKDYLPKKDKCFKVSHVAEVNNHTVNMDDMQGSFFVLFFGFATALLVIFVEKLWNRYRSKREKKLIQPYTS